MKIFTEATLGAEQIADQLQKAHAASFELTQKVVFVGSPDAGKSSLLNALSEKNVKNVRKNNKNSQNPLEF